MSLDHLYISSFSSQRPTVTQDQYGAGAKTFAASISSFKGRLQQKTATEAQTSGKITATSNYVLYCDPSNDINSKDRIIFGSRTYEVVNTDNSNQMNVIQRVELLEIV